MFPKKSNTCATDTGSLQINTHLRTHTNKTETHKSAVTLSIFKNERHMDSKQRKVLFALREDGQCNKTSSKSVLKSKLNTEGFLRSPQDKSDWHWSCGLLLFLCLLVFLHGRCCAGENVEYLFYHIFLKVFNQLCWLNLLIQQTVPASDPAHTTCRFTHTPI